MAFQFMQIDIARLVYGYLKETNCKETSKLFLEESKHLGEFGEGIKRGINYSTNINGKSLVETLNEITLGDLKQCSSPTCGSRQSEISRFVHGYFLDMNCHRTAEKFCQESPIKFNNKTMLQVLGAEMFSVSSAPTGQTGRQDTGTTQTTPQQDSSSMAQLLSVVEKNSERVFKLEKCFKKLSDQISETNKRIEESLSRQNEMSTHLLSTPKHSRQSAFLKRNLDTTSHYSPRRKSATPRRLAQSSPVVPSYAAQQAPASQLSTISAMSECSGGLFSSPLSSNAESDIEIVQPQLIYDELLKCTDLQEQIANEINQKIARTDGPGNANHNLNSNSNSNSNDIMNSISTEDLIPQLDLNPACVYEILTSLQDNPMVNNFLDNVVEKEIANTPFKHLFPTISSSPGSSATPGSTSSSLNTPKIFFNTPFNRDINASSNFNNSSVAVKRDLMKDLKTPIKPDDKLTSTSQSQEVVHNDSMVQVSQTDISSQAFDADKTLTPSLSGTQESSSVFNNSNPTSMNQDVEQTTVENEKPCKVKPVFPNQHLNTSRHFHRGLERKQKEVHDALDYQQATSTSAFNGNTWSNTPPTTSSSNLTTMIEVVPEANQQSEEQVEDSSQVILSQSLDQVKLNNADNPVLLVNDPSMASYLVFTSGPNYSMVNPTTVASTSLITADQLATMSGFTVISNTGETQSVLATPETLSQLPIVTSESNLPILTSTIHVTAGQDHSQRLSSSSDLSNKSSPKNRTLPAILSKGAKQRSSLSQQSFGHMSNESNRSTVRTNDNRRSSDSSSMHNRSSSSERSKANDAKAREEEIRKNRKESRKSEIRLNHLYENDDPHNRNKRRKNNDKERPTPRVEDQQIKKLFNTNIDKFLDNLHNNKDKRSRR